MPHKLAKILGSLGRCCINRAKAIDVYAHRAPASPLSSQISESLPNFSKKMRKDIHKTGEPKARYHVRNWSAYIMQA
ncbi:MAG: hypothetical protein VB140_02880 [Burkholderia sp.]|nr:MAG: hypothetical protein E5299_00374 [Burkholderia gladioli]